MKIAIVGPGAVGCLFSSYLKRAGNDVVLIDYKKERARDIAVHGVTVEEEDGDRTSKVNVSADPASCADADGIMFAVKAYATEEAAARVAPNVPKSAWVLTLQNGMGNTDALSKYFKKNRILAGTTSEGATLLGPGKVRHGGHGETFIGELEGARSKRVGKIVDAFAAAGFASGAADNVSLLLWKKLIVSVGINPITALLRIKNGEILEREKALLVSRAAAEEAAAIARKAGVELGSLDIRDLVESVAKRTSANISSMHQDIAAGRRTEIDFICGYVVRIGESLGMPTPVNTILYELVSALSD